MIDKLATFPNNLDFWKVATDDVATCLDRWIDR